MAVPARSESPLATRTPRGGAANDGYGSLMGMGAPRKKKKPVLVLDADELAKAHLDMAAGGAQIMEAAGDPEAEQRVRAPSSLLGLAPMGAEDAEMEDASAYPPIPDASTWEDEDVVLPQMPEDYTDEGDLDEEEEDSSEPSYNLEHLLRPSAPDPDEEEEERSSVIPSIEEQLKRMRALPTPEPEAEEEPATRRAGPMSRLDEMGFGLGGQASEDLPEYQPEPEDVLDAEEPFELDQLFEEETPEAEEPVEVAPEPAPEPVAEEDEPLELDILAELVEEDVVAPEPAPEREPAPEPEPEPVDYSEGPQVFDPFEDGPDLSWMEPEQRRELQIAQGEHSALRKRLVHAEEGVEEVEQLSLMQRLRAWIAGLFGR